MDNYKNLVALYHKGKKRLDPLVDKKIQAVITFTYFSDFELFLTKIRDQYFYAYIRSNNAK